MASLAPDQRRSRVWLQAIRPRTLPAAAVPIGVGTCVAVREGTWLPALAACALTTALLLQIGANLANDLYDFLRGADDDQRLGPARMTQQGLVSPTSMRRATFIVLLLAGVAGLPLVWRGGWPLVLVGLTALGAAYAYTGGPWPLGYRGLGDALVFLFFGGVGVVGTTYLHSLELSSLSLWMAVPIGLLATAILAVNNLRDIASDARIGKRTLAVRLGVRATRHYYGALMLGAHMAVIVPVATHRAPLACGLVLLCLPASVRLVRAVASRAGRELNPYLGATALHEMGFGLLLSLGLLL